MLRNYAARVVDGELDEVFPQLPAVLLDGAKGVGKTETALQRAQTVRRLDQPGPLAVAQADPDTVVVGTPPVLIDEWHRAPAVFDSVKRSVDSDPTGGRFLLTGSAVSPGQTTHSGAGRITTLRMRPMTLVERGLTQPTVSLFGLVWQQEPNPTGTATMNLVDYVDAMMASGFPGLRTLTGRALRLALDGYLDRIFSHEIVEAGLTLRSAEGLRAWLSAYAAATSTATSWDKVRDAATPGEGAKPSKTATRPFRDTLDTMRVLDDLPAWQPSASQLRRLTQGPKHHLVDPALAARLLGFTADTLLTGGGVPNRPAATGPFVGALFESLCVQNVRVFAQAAEARTYHLRTRDSVHEVDIIVERDDGGVLAIEVQLSTTVGDDDVRHLRWLSQQIGDRMVDAVVLNTGPQAYRRPDGIAVVPLALLGR